MSEYKFSELSAKNLSTCDERLQRVAKRALSYGIMDFAITEGNRSVEKQQEYFHKGLSKIDGVTKKSNHQYSPSKAMDVMPLPRVVNGIDVWKDNQRFSVLAGMIYAAACEEGVKIRWGGDWDTDGNNADSSFHDMPHFEILE